MTDDYVLGPDHSHPTPAGAKRFGVYSYAWAVWGLGFAVIEGLALRKNLKHGGFEDYQHRTLTENIRWLGATDRDGQNARFKRSRRILLLSAVVTGVAHFLTDGDYI